MISRQTTLAAAALACVALCMPWAHAAPAVAVPCKVEPAKVLLDQRVSLAGDGTVRLPLPASAAALLQVSEEGIDVSFDVEDANGKLLAQADSPIARQGVQHAELPERRATSFLIIRGNEHPRLTGYVRISLSAPTRARAPNDCMTFVRLMAQADSAFAEAMRQLRAVAGSQAKPGNLAIMRALEEYRRIGNALGDRSALAGRRGVIELSTASVYYFHLSDWKESAAWAARAMQSFADSQDAYLQARAEALRDSAWLEMPNVDARYDEARKSLSRLVKFHHERSEAYDETLQTNNIGLAYYAEAHFEEAVRYLTVARDAFERLGEIQRFALALQNLALCDWGQGRSRSAASTFSRALKLMRPDPYLDMYLLTLNNSAMAHRAAGMLDEALSQHQHANELAGRAGMELEVARSLYGLGVTYYAIGDPALARDFLERALALLAPAKTLVDGREVIKEPDSRARLATLRALANLEQESGALDAADAHYRDALTIATVSNVRARIQLRLALGDLARGKHEAAIVVATKIAQDSPDVNAVTQALARVVRAKALRVRRDLPGATADLTLAIDTFKKSQVLAEEFDARVELARVQREAGFADAALEELRVAIGASEELRAQTANPVLRASVANDIRPALDFALELLRERYESQHAAGAGAAAAQVAHDSLELADTSRAQSLYQLLMQRAEAGDAPKLAQLAEERARLMRDLADRRYYLSIREERPVDDDLNRSLRAEIDRLRASLDIVENEISQLLAGRESARNDKQGWKYSPPPGGAAVEYWLGEKAAYAWVVGKDGIDWVRLGAATKIADTARALKTSLAGYYSSANHRETRSNVESRALDLHRLVVQPIAGRLGGFKSLTIVPDGALHFVPFAMLRASAQDQYLVQRWAVRYTPALWLNDGRIARAPTAAARILLISDPVYQASDERVGQGGAAVAATPRNSVRLRDAVDPTRLERLTGSIGEATGIRALFPLSDVEEVSGLDAVRARVLERDLAGYRYVHIAAHANADEEIPSLSSLVLGAFDRSGRVEDQQVRVGDLLGKRFAADVVVLSACNTSLGRSYSQEGPIGLHYAVLARGAHAVVASLWPVADETNAELMTDIYRRMIKQDERVDMALAGAMRAQITAHPDREPVLWAPYNTYVID